MAIRLEVGQSTGQFEVDSRERYVASGVLLDQGGTYDISVVDPEQIWIDRDLPSTADGNPDPSWVQQLVDCTLRCRDGRWFQLIGAVGRSDEHLFPIGTRVQWHYTTGSADEDRPELYLFANDAWLFYGNNHGSLHVSITRVS